MQKPTIGFLTVVNVLVLALVIAFSGIGHTLAQAAAQSVLITNTSSAPVPSDVLLHPYEVSGTATFSANQNNGSAIVVAPSRPAGQCLHLTTLSY